VSSSYPSLSYRGSPVHVFVLHCINDKFIHFINPQQTICDSLILNHFELDNGVMMTMKIYLAINHSVDTCTGLLAQ